MSLFHKFEAQYILHSAREVIRSGTPAYTKWEPETTPLEVSQFIRSLVGDEAFETFEQMDKDTRKRAMDHIAETSGEKVSALLGTPLYETWDGKHLRLNPDSGLYAYYVALADAV